MEPEKMVFWLTFVALCTAGNQLRAKKREKIVDFNVGILATHQVTELRWLRKPMVVSKLTRNWIQWTRNLWALVSSITDNLCHLQLDSME